MSTFREQVPKMAVLWKAEGVNHLAKSAKRARRAFDGLTKPTAYRSLVEVLAISYEEAERAFAAAWDREVAARPDLVSGLNADVGRVP